VLASPTPRKDRNEVPDVGALELLECVPRDLFDPVGWNDIRILARELFSQPRQGVSDLLVDPASRAHRTTSCSPWLGSEPERLHGDSHVGSARHALLPSADVPGPRDPSTTRPPTFRGRDILYLLPGNRRRCRRRHYSAVGSCRGSARLGEVWCESSAMWGVGMAGGKARLPPRWFVVTFWHMHRRIVRASRGRKGLWPPAPGSMGLFGSRRQAGAVASRGA
jgi:hypothetical protein